MKLSAFQVKKGNEIKKGILNNIIAEVMKCLIDGSLADFQIQIKYIGIMKIAICFTPRDIPKANREDVRCFGHNVSDNKKKKMAIKSM